MTDKQAQVARLRDLLYECPLDWDTIGEVGNTLRFGQFAQWLYEQGVRVVDAAGGREPPEGKLVDIDLPPDPPEWATASQEAASRMTPDKTANEVPASPRAAAPEENPFGPVTDAELAAARIELRAAAAPECPVRKAAERIAAYGLSDEFIAERFDDDCTPEDQVIHAWLRSLRAALAAPCVPAGPEPSEAAIEALWNGIGAIPYLEKHVVREALRVAYAAQFGSPERGTAAPKKEGL